MKKNIFSVLLVMSILISSITIGGISVSAANTSFETAKIIHLDTEEVVNIESEDEGYKKYYKFIPEDTGIYYIRSFGGFPYSSDPYGELYDADFNLLTSHDNILFYPYRWDFDFEYALKEGKTYYIATGSYDKFDQYEYSTFNVQIKQLASFNDAVTISLNESKTVDITEFNQRKILKFIPNVTADYTIESIGGWLKSYMDEYEPRTSMQPMGIIYDENLKPFYEEQDYDNDFNFSRTFEANKTYYITTGLKDNRERYQFIFYDTGSYAVKITTESVLEWSSGVFYEAGQIISFGADSNGNSVHYTVLQSHTSMAHWMPGSTPSLYKLITVPLWSQPIGLIDAYSIGDEVMYNGQIWVSAIDANVWKPGVHGWTRIS